MTKFTKIILLTLTSLLLFTGCGTKEESKTPSNTATVESNKNSEEAKPETVSFFADGEYQAGVDIKPGSYYAVLTELQTEGPDAYVGFTYGNIDGGDYDYEQLKIVEKPYKIEVTENTKLKFESWQGASIWNITLFTADDYKEYQASEKK